MSWLEIVGVTAYTGVGIFFTSLFFLSVRAYIRRQRERRITYDAWKKKKNESGVHVNSDGILVDPKGELNDE